MPFVFEPQAGELSLVNARLLGHAAAKAYEDPAACRQWALDAGLDQDFDFFANKDTQGFVAQNEQVILVAFRGTQPDHPADWLSDFKSLAIGWDHPEGKVHQGFYQALQAVWHATPGGEQILPRRLANRGDRAVWITGHSLGGALAALCAAQAHFVHGIPIQGVYTFGQPRVGTQAFSEALQAALGTRVFRFVNNRDIVPRVPLFGMSYRHCGWEVFFDSGGDRRERTSAVEDLAAAARLGFFALDLEPAREIGSALAGAVQALKQSRKPAAAVEKLITERELRSLGDPRAILARGTQNVTDHDMRKCYLARLETSA